MHEESDHARATEREPTKDQAQAPQDGGARSSVPQEAKPPPPEIRLTYSEVIRELMMMHSDVLYYRNVVSLGSQRERRAKALDLAAEIVERQQRQSHERRKLDRR